MSDRWPHEALDPFLKMLAPRFYGGTPTAFGSPFVEEAAALADFDVAYLGIPWASPAAPGRETSIVYAGTMLAPNKFRHNSIKYGGYLPELDVHVFERLRFCDFGNVDIVSDMSTSLANVAERVGKIVDAGCLPLTMGGNGPGAGNPVLQAIAERAGGPVAIVNFDAHHDNMTFSPEQVADPRGTAWGEGWASMIFDIPNVDPALFQHVGLRGPRNDRGAVQRFADRGVPRDRIYTYRDLKAARRTGFDEWAEEVARRTAGAAKVWIAVDPDVIDIAAAPHGEPLGLHVEEIVELVRAVGKAAGRERLGGVSFMAMPPDEIHVHWICTYILLYAFAGMLEAAP